METVKGLTLHRTSFVIDGKRLIDCTLIDCTIEYAGGPVILERTALHRCRYVFSGTAKMTIEFLDCVGLTGTADSTRNGEDCLVH